MFNAGIPGSPINNVFGIMTGTASATQFPSQAALQACIQADPDNKGPVFLGSSTTTCSWQLAAGTNTGWVTTDNLNKFFQRAASGTMDYVNWWIQR